MQQYAEDAIKEHLGDFLQPLFFKEKQGSKNAPYAGALPQARVEELLTRAMKQTERYNVMKSAGASEQEIRKAFDTPQEMSVFTWAGEKDTIMTPMDSIRYYKHFPAYRIHVDGPDDRICEGVCWRTELYIFPI